MKTNPVCLVIFDESDRHFQLECPRFDNMRSAAIKTSHKSNNLNIRRFPHAEQNSKMVDITFFFEVREFIILSKRFHK